MEEESSRLKELERLMGEEDRNSSSPAPSSSRQVVSSERKTAAEKRFEEVQKKRVRDKLLRCWICFIETVPSLQTGWLVWQARRIKTESANSITSWKPSASTTTFPRYALLLRARVTYLTMRWQVGPG